MRITEYSVNGMTNGVCTVFNNKLYTRTGKVNENMQSVSFGQRSGLFVT